MYTWCSVTLLTMISHQKISILKDNFFNISINQYRTEMKHCRLPIFLSLRISYFQKVLMIQFLMLILLQSNHTKKKSRRTLSRTVSLSISNPKFVLLQQQRIRSRKENKLLKRILNISQVLTLIVKILPFLLLFNRLWLIILFVIYI